MGVCYSKFKRSLVSILKSPTYAYSIQAEDNTPPPSTPPPSATPPSISPLRPTAYAPSSPVPPPSICPKRPATAAAPPPSVPPPSIHNESPTASTPPPPPPPVLPPSISPKTPTDDAPPLTPPPIGPYLRKPYVDIASLYDLGLELGGGQFGVIYLCWEKSTGRKYACKSMPKTHPTIPQQVMRYLISNEVKILQHLKGQPNVIEFKGAYEDEEEVHVVMEVCSGGDLYERRGSYSEKEAAGIMRQILKAIQACHFMGVMHRDVKPENFLLVTGDKGSQLKAIDFGLSTFIEPGEVYEDGVGSPYCMAPEVLRQKYGKEIDVWSAGATLYILLSTNFPFHAETDEGRIEAIKEGKVDLTSHPWPLISSDAKDIIRRMLTVDPEKRITVAEALEHPWLKQDGEASDKSIDSAILIRIKQFMAMNKLKKLALKVIAENLSAAERQGLKQIFNNMDTDGSGAITYEELRTGLIKLGSKLSEEEIQLLVEAVDIDKNGTIDYYEFTMATMHPHRVDDEEKLYKAFRHFDKDKCGYITRDELSQAMAQYGIGDGTIIDEVLDDVDANNDGKINYDEFVAMMRKGIVDLGEKLWK
ncbi:Calcium-dependent protein kinase 33 [Orobanche minor]